MTINRKDIYVGLVVERNILTATYLRKVLYVLNKETNCGIDLLNINTNCGIDDITNITYPIASRSNKNKYSILPCYNLDETLKKLKYKSYLTDDDINDLIGNNISNILNCELINTINNHYINSSNCNIKYSFDEIIKQFILSENEQEDDMKKNLFLKKKKIKK